MPGKTSPAQDLIDIHCHQFSHASHSQILSLDAHELADAQVYTLAQTSSRPEDSISGSCYFSLGIHPWFIERQNIDSALQALIALKDHPKLLAIGECGLDKCIDTPMSMQIEVFSRQIQLSEDFGKPLIIHCVRAFAELLHLKKSQAPSQAWIMHGFTGRPGLAAQLIQHGCYISFGKALLLPGSPASQTLQAIPINRLFLETDAADLSIDTIYAAAAKIRGIDPAHLRRQIHTNFSNVFLND
ncbi:MAG: TatD family hydrolase [Methylomonas sp.]|jgi:TatD DNase family protein|uniref:TatD family hydrolase n=1 Tax=Methylomonas sp. TaxID=418 RepID=UPI0025DBBCD9|nr:TatD family hydrolase [Methylomonas sp.]MCK9605619.1 TatD family hydrolase [Methylomonas sp.]